MKLLFTIAGYYRPAGMERVLAGKATWLTANGIDVTIITTEQRNRPHAFPLPEKVKLIDLAIGYEDNNGANIFSKIFALPIKKLRHRRALKKILEIERPDVAVSMFCGDEGFLPKIAPKNTMTILECHFSRNKRLQYERRGLWSVADRIRSKAEPRKAARFDRFVLLTHQDLRDWGTPANAMVIPNARTFTPDQFDGCEKTKTVLAAGRYCHQKHFDALLAAWKMISPSARKGWALRIAGQGPDEEMLKAQADQAVVFGPATDMKTEYAKASIFALSSRYEGLPMVLLEAQAAGLPIVAFDCKCGPAEVVHHGTDGYLASPDSASDLAICLEKLMTEDDLRAGMSEAARKASDSFKEDDIMHRWMQVFTKSDSKEPEAEKRRIVVSAVSLRKGGTLTILRQVLEYLSTRDDIIVTALVHNRRLCWYPGIEYIEIPWAIRSWMHRLWCEYVTMYRISKRMAAQNGPVDVWLGMHDTTPRVIAKKREVYCHTSFPFLKLRLRDFIMDPKIPAFKLLTPVYYKIGAKHNDSIIVQQQWFANSLSRMMRVPIDRFRVIPPAGADSGVLAGRKVSWFNPNKPKQLAEEMERAMNEGCRTFLFASTPDCHKNFECLCQAAKILEPYHPEMKVTITVRGDENKYARWLFKKWGAIKCIDFRGLMSRDDLDTAYKKTDCFVFPSRIETWGLPVSEYAQANRYGQIIISDLDYAHSYESIAVR